METNQQEQKTSKFSLRPWLVYTEILAIIGFIVLAVLLSQRSGADPKPTSLSNVESLITEADVLFESQDLGNAVLLYWQALNIMDHAKSKTNESERLHINLRIAEIYSQNNWLKDAQSRLKYASDIDPEHEQVLLLSGKFLRDGGLQEEASKKFLSVVEKNPDNAEAHYLLGVLYQGRKQYTDASSHYTVAIDKDPNLQHIPSEKAPIGILARLQLSRTYNKMLQGFRLLDRELTSEDYDEMARLETQSILLLKEANQLRPGMHEIINDLIGLLYFRAILLKREAATRPYADALEVYEEIVELDPTEIQAWQDMAEIYESYLRDKPKALEMYREVYKLEPHSTILAIIISLEEDIEIENEGMK